MKKYIFTAAFMAASAVGFAQDSEEKGIANLQDRKHELRIDALEGLIVPALDISYEYVISKYSGVGVSAFAGFSGDDDLDFDQDWAFTPYYRQYFFNKKDYGARGFYAEGLLQVAGGDDFDNFLIGTNTDESWTKFGIGFGLGQKWVSKNGFVLDLNFGGGRYFGDDNLGPDAFFRGGVGVGYRF